MRIMALDIGNARVGVAVSDPAERVASPVCVLPAGDVVGCAKPFKRLLEDWEPELLLCGLPYTLAGEEGPQAAHVRDVAQRIGRACGLPVAFADERLSSREAKRSLREKGMDEKAMRGKMFARARVIICIPSGVTAVERRAVREAADQAGAKPVLIVEEPMAAAIGAGLPTTEPIGCMVVDIGGGTSEVAVIALGGIVVSQSVRCAGDEFDAAIINFIKKRYNLLIGERTAESIKMQIGSAYPVDRDEIMQIKGRNLMSGLPENVNISSKEVREALSEPLSRIVDAIKCTLEQTPPELAADIIDHGITLTGGGALLRGLDQLIHKETGMPVFIAEYPLDCVAEGTGKILENLDKYRDAVSDDPRGFE